MCFNMNCIYFQKQLIAYCIKELYSIWSCIWMISASKWIPNDHFIVQDLDCLTNNQLLGNWTISASKTDPWWSFHIAQDLDCLTNNQFLGNWRISVNQMDPLWLFHSTTGPWLFNKQWTSWKSNFFNKVPVEYRSPFWTMNFLEIEWFQPIKQIPDDHSIV